MFHSHVNTICHICAEFKVLALAIHCSKANNICDKWSQTMEDCMCTSIKLFINHSGHFQNILYGEQEGTDPQGGMAIHVIQSCKSAFENSGNEPGTQPARLLVSQI